MYKRLAFWLALAAAILGQYAAYAADATTYNIGVGTTTLQDMTGASTLISTGQDDVFASTAIGFPFAMGSGSFSNVTVTSNGLVIFGASLPANHYDNLFPSSLSSGLPAITPGWDDFVTASNGSVKTLLTGSAPNRTFVIQWQVRLYDGSGIATGVYDKTFQLWLLENNDIRMVYGTGTAFSGASVGIATALNNFRSITPGTPTSSSTVTENNNVTTWPGAGASFSMSSTLPLPLTLTQFSGTRAGTTARLSWTVAEEAGPDRYVVERSTDGADFAPVGEVRAMGGDRSYAFTDPQAPGTAAFYRLNITEIDGSFSLSTTVALPATADENGGIRFGPVPAGDVLSLTNSVAADNGKPFSILDSRGRTLYQANLASSQTIRMDQWPAGRYYLRTPDGHTRNLLHK